MNKMKESTIDKIMTVALIVTIITVSTVAIFQVYKIHSSGQIKAIGVIIYNDPNTTNKITSIDWGNLKAGDVVSVTLYAKNIKNVPFIMTLNVTNWQPQIAEQYITLSWTYNNQTINPNEVAQFDIILTVDVNIDNVNTFNNDIYIKATEINGGV